MGKKVIVAGHICLDITPVFPDRKVEAIGDILTPGKLLQMGGVDVHTGGAVANTGLAMKFLGADAVLMGKVGKDAFGDMICDILGKYGADAGMIRIDGESTSYSVVLAIPGIDRIFLHNHGANDTFCANDIRQEDLEGAALFHFGYPPLMRAIYEREGEELLAVLKKAKAAGAATSLDMASVDPESEAGKANWNQILKKVIPYVDFFVPSVEELLFMLDREKFYWLVRQAKGRELTRILDREKDIRPLADQCMAYGAKVVLIKCGVPGIYYRTADAQCLSGVGSRMGLCISQWADKEGFEASYVPEQVLSGTGAGDTSIAAFLAAALDGETLEETVHLAAAAGASCVAAYDALSGLKSLKELKEKIAAGWEKVNIP